MTPYFIDTNVFIRFLTKDSELSSKAYKILKSISRGKIKAILIESIFTEICYILSSKKLPYHYTHRTIAELLQPIIKMDYLLMKDKSIYINALDIYSQNNNLDIEDCLLLSHMKFVNTNKILSFDKAFEKQSSIKVSRIENI